VVLNQYQLQQQSEYSGAFQNNVVEFVPDSLKQSSHSWAQLSV